MALGKEKLLAADNHRHFLCDS